MHLKRKKKQRQNSTHVYYLLLLIKHDNMTMTLLWLKYKFIWICKNHNNFPEINFKRNLYISICLCCCTYQSNMAFRLKIKEKEFWLKNETFSENNLDKRKENIVWKSGISYPNDVLYHNDLGSCSQVLLSENKGE